MPTMTEAIERNRQREAAQKRLFRRSNRYSLLQAFCGWLLADIDAGNTEQANQMLAEIRKHLAEEESQ